jgi:phosphosulfolactate phosphohydrolase-like enzyme
VIDVLHTSSTITTTLTTGSNKIIPVYLLKEAHQRKENFRPGRVLLYAEEERKSSQVLTWEILHGNTITRKSKIK